MPKLRTNNFIYFYHLNKYLLLPVEPDSVTDSSSVSWSPVSALGRTAPIQAYSGSGPRTVNFTLKLHRDMMLDYDFTGKDKLRKKLKKGDSSGNGAAVDFTNNPGNYVDTLIKYLQSATLPKYKIYESGSKSLEPPMVACRIGDDIFIRGVVSSQISVTYNKPLITYSVDASGISEEHYGEVSIGIAITETDPYDAEGVSKVGSFRGLTRAFANGIFQPEDHDVSFTYDNFAGATSVSRPGNATIQTYSLGDPYKVKSSGWGDGISTYYPGYDDLDADEKKLVLDLSEKLGDNLSAMAIVYTKKAFDNGYIKVSKNASMVYDPAVKLFMQGYMDNNSKGWNYYYKLWLDWEQDRGTIPSQWKNNGITDTPFAAVIAQYIYDNPQDYDLTKLFKYKSENVPVKTLGDPSVLYAERMMPAGSNPYLQHLMTMASQSKTFCTDSSTTKSRLCDLWQKCWFRWGDVTKAKEELLWQLVEPVTPYKMLQIVNEMSNNSYKNLSHTFYAQYGQGLSFSNANAVKVTFTMKEVIDAWFKHRSLSDKILNTNTHYVPTINPDEVKIAKQNGWLNATLFPGLVTTDTGARGNIGFSNDMAGRTYYTWWTAIYDCALKNKTVSTTRDMDANGNHIEGAKPAGTYPHAYDAGDSNLGLRGFWQLHYLLTRMVPTLALRDANEAAKKEAMGDH